MAPLGSLSISDGDILAAARGAQAARAQAGSRVDGRPLLLKLHRSQLYARAPPRQHKCPPRRSTGCTAIRASICYASFRVKQQRAAGPRSQHARRRRSGSLGLQGCATVAGVVAPANGFRPEVRAIVARWSAHARGLDSLILLPGGRVAEMDAVPHGDAVCRPFVKRARQDSNL